jgi:hypothetical protein
MSPAYLRISAARRSGLRLDCQVEDHFLLMASLRVWDFRVNALISYRRGRKSRLYAGLGARSPAPRRFRWVFALRDGLLNRIVRITA